MSTLISLLMPTRGRPEHAKRFLRSAAEHAESSQDVEVVIYADTDDPASHSISSATLRTQVVVGPRVSMGQCNTACLEASSGAVVLLTNDDVVVHTHGWDRRIRELHESVDDGIYLAYPNDLLKGHRLCTFPILSRRTCELLREPFPREYRGAFIDYHLLDIFKRLQARGRSRLFYLGDVVFEHMHYRVGKGKHDATYRDRGRFVDDATFLSLRDRRELAAQRLLGCVEPRNAEAGLSRALIDPDPSLSRHQGMFIALCKDVLFDPGLPLQWRMYLWFWFIGRMLAARVLLPGIGR